MKEFFPKDIAQFLDKHRVCVHWSGEVGAPMDAERAKRLEQDTKGCDQLPSTRKQLETKYASNPILSDMRTTIEEIDAGESLKYSFIWKDPQKKSRVLNKFVNAQAEGVLKNVTTLMKDYDAELRKDVPQLGFLPFMLFVQWGYLQEVLREEDRLKPETRSKIDALSKDRLFEERVAEYRRKSAQQRKPDFSGTWGTTKTGSVHKRHMRGRKRHKRI
jgi:hypothetical protein